MTAGTLLHPGIQPRAIARIVLSITLYAGLMIVVRALADRIHMFEMVLFRALFGARP